MKMFFSSRLVPLVSCEPWIEQTRPSVLLARAKPFPGSLLLEVVELGEGSTQTKSHRSALLIFDINTVINF